MTERMTEARREEAKALVKKIKSIPGTQCRLAEAALLDCWQELEALRQENRGLRWLRSHNCPPPAYCVGHPDCWECDCEKDCCEPWLANGAPGMVSEKKTTP
jgi:hypothetical protein